MDDIQKNYSNMKSPLSYQISEYDCGQATLLNAIRFLFNRGEIPPIILKYITQCTLDTINNNGEIGKFGTSSYAIEYLANWINSSSDNLNINLEAKILKDEDVNINNKEFIDCVSGNGVAILKVWSDCEHYVLCTGIGEKHVYIFDPYYLEDYEYDKDSDVVMISNKPFEYNRIVSKRRLEEDSKNDYSLVKNNESIILLLYR